jgi:tRNA pseudouridine synthase 10
VFHAAGREDADVRMLGNGRPFMLELVDCHTRVSAESCAVRHHSVCVAIVIVHALVSVRA